MVQPESSAAFVEAARAVFGPDSRSGRDGANVLHRPAGVARQPEPMRARARPPRSLLPMLALLLAVAWSPQEPDAQKVLWYRQPAAAWTEALPVGNGRLGAMVYGRTADETIQLNEEIWEQSLSGIVRRDDVLPNNTVLSEDIAELRIMKREVGSVRDGYRRGWFLRILDRYQPF